MVSPLSSTPPPPSHPNAISHHTITAYLALPHDHGIIRRQPGLMVMEAQKETLERMEGDLCLAKEGDGGVRGRWRTVLVRGMHTHSHFGDLGAHKNR